MKHKNLELKIQNCTHAYHSYQHLLIAIKDMMRGGDFQPNILHTMMNNIDNHVTDNSPIIDKFLQKYDKNFHLSMIPFILSPISNIIFPIFLIRI